MLNRYLCLRIRKHFLRQLCCGYLPVRYWFVKLRELRVGHVLGGRCQRLFQLSCRHLLIRIRCERLRQLSRGHKVFKHWNHCMYELCRGQVFCFIGKHSLHMVQRRILPSEHGRDKLH